jgi:hypothetical protein
MLKHNRHILSKLKNSYIKIVLKEHRFLSRKIQAIWKKHPVWVAAIAVAGVAISVFGFLSYQNAQRYTLNNTDLHLLTKSSVDQSKIKFEKEVVSYNRKTEAKNAVTVDGAIDATGKQMYRATLSANTKQGIEFADAQSDMPLKLVPLEPTGGGKYVGGHMVYPSKGGKTVYTLRKNGIKGDILLSKAPGKQLSYSWKLDLGGQLEAKMLPDGSVGVYSANPLFYSSNLTVGDQKSQELIDNAKKVGAKDTLAYVLPRPYFKDADGKISNDDVSFSLKDDTLTLKAVNLESKKYPLSIDPTIVVTSTTLSPSFRTGYDDGNIDYTTTADEIDRGNISLGTMGAFGGATTFSESRYLPAAVAYSGYLYIAGGLTGGVPANNCSSSSSGYCNDVIYAQINSNGTLGSFTSAGTFTKARNGLAAAAYNGYFYIAGGRSNNNTGNCITISNYCNDVQYATINSSTGALGSFTSAGTFTTERSELGAAIYNGYFYIAGGVSDSSTGNCSTSLCKDVQYAAINANGSLGSFATAGTFTNPRQGLAATVYNGYFYIAGGTSVGGVSGNCNVNNYCNDVIYAQLNSDGTLGSFATAGTFTNARNDLAAVAANGYFYIIGGVSDTSTGNCANGVGICKDVQYAAINANGSLGSFASVTFTNARAGLAGAAYNGRLYIAGGLSNTTANNCTDGIGYCKDAQMATISTGTPTFGTIGSFAAANTFTNARIGLGAAVYNGYFYIAGGQSDSATNNCNNNGVLNNRVCNDVIYAAINANGTLGTFATAGTFTNARVDLGAAVYNGYFYIAGGQSNASANNCVSSFMCNDVIYAAINANGTLGTFATAGTFTNARIKLGAAVYNGYFYIAGGQTNIAAGNCNNAVTGACNDVIYAQINSNGTLGAFATAATFTNARYDLGAAAYNGYFYIAGGSAESNTGNCANTSRCNEVIYAQINSNGTLGAFATAGTFTNARSGLGAAAYNGYFYIAGGVSNSATGNCAHGAANVCNDVQYAQINSNGTLGAFATAGTFTNARTDLAAAAYNGYFYMAGGLSDSGTNNCNNGANHSCNDAQYVQVKSPEQAGTYEKIVDAGVGGIIASLNFNGRAVCGMGINYRLAGSNGVFGSTTNIAFGLPGTYSVSGTGSRYIWMQFKMNDAKCGTNSQITDITINYVTAPAPPTLSAPSSGATNVSTAPLFQLRTTDADNDYLQYKIEVCSVSDCSSVLRTIDQTSDQTGWTAQNAGPGGNTAYIGNSSIGSSTMANHTYQLPPLSANTQYWWRAYAIDPGGTNSFSTVSSIFTFTTGNEVPSVPTLVAPTSGQSGQSTLPQFQLRSTDLNSDYLRYAIKVYSTETECNNDSATNLVRSIDQTSSQTGWSSQDTQNGQAYQSNYILSSSSMAYHFYQSSPLTPNTTYWWKGQAKDPGGSNTWSAWSTCQSFNTTNTETRIQGNVKIQGTTKIGN